MAGYLEKRGKHSWRLIVSHGFDSYGNRIKYTKASKQIVDVRQIKNL